MGFVSIKVTPRASKSRIEVSNQLVKVYTSAPPVDGEANEAVIALLAKSLGIAKSRIEIVAGFSSREKRLSIPELTDEEILSKLEGPKLF